MGGMNGINGVGPAGRQRLPANHPILRLESKVGRFAHRLPGNLVAEVGYWRQVSIRVGDKELVCPARRQQIPTVLLPIFKRMLEVPFDILVSIPRAGDPLAFALLRMSEACEKIGIPVAKMPKHESFGGGRDTKIANFYFLSMEDRIRTLSSGARRDILAMVGGLSPSLLTDLLMGGRTFESFESVLDQDLGAILRWFMVTGHPKFVEAAVPILTKIMQETDLAAHFREVNKILIVDDVAQDLDAYRSVKQPLSVFAPHARVEVGLMSGSKKDEDINAICGSLRGGWVMMKKREGWTGQKGCITQWEVAHKVVNMLSHRLEQFTQGVSLSDLGAILFVLVVEKLYEMGQLFSQKSSWERAWARASFEDKYGGERLSDFCAIVEREITPSFVEQLVTSSPLFSRMSSGRRDIERGVKDLFGRDLDRKLLEAYLRSKQGYEEMRPVSDLLALMHQ